MSNNNKYTFTANTYKGHESANNVSGRNNMTDEVKKQFKKELMDVFERFGYPLRGKDHEVTFRTTSGNIAWININRIEIIK